MTTSDSVMVEEATPVDREPNGRPGETDPPPRAPSEPAGTSRPGAAGGIWAKLRRGDVRQALISVGLIVTLAAIFSANMPTSSIKSHLMVAAQPYLNGLGLGEDWGVFAPNPRQEVIYGTGVIAYSDGSRSEWSFPVRPGIMAYSDYRWQKFEEHVRLDSFQGLWKPFSEYLVRHEAIPGKTPVQVGLARRWAAINPPGVSPSLGPWSKYMYSVMNVGGAK